MLRLLTVTFFALTFTACSTSMIKSMSKIEPGMDKDSVIELVGGPNRTFREDGRDHWIFVYHQNDVQWLRDVTFEKGKVLKLSEPITKAAWERELEATTTMEEYEEKAREHQKASAKKNEP